MLGGRSPPKRRHRHRSTAHCRPPRRTDDRVRARARRARNLKRMNRTSRYPMRRILVFAVVMVVLVGVFVVKLVDVQIVRASELNVQAQEARSVPVTVYGARGDIVDAAGQVLADT